MNKETLRSPELENKPASIHLEFFRHDAKAKATTDGDRTGDEYVRLTPEGRINSTAVGKTKNPHAEASVAFGSPRERSQETAMRQMLANEDAITPDSSLEDIRALVDQNLKVGKKDAVKASLNFDWDTNKQFHDAIYPRFLETKDALSFLYHDSDNLVKQLKDKTSSSYSRTAGSFAEIVKKYLEILPRWKKIAKENPEKYAKLNNAMERYFGSHAVTVELFLMKVMEKTKGPKAVEEFVKGPKKNGFSPSEGYSVNIIDSDSEPQISITYAGKTMSLSQEQLEEIINDGEKLEQEILGN